MVHKNDGEQRWSRLVLAWASALGLALILAALWGCQIGLASAPVADSTFVAGVAQGTLCLLLAGLLAPRRVALATLPVLPLVAATMPAVGIGVTLVAFQRMGGHYAASDLLRSALPPRMYPGFAAVMVGGLVVVCLLLVVRTARARAALALAGVLVAGGLWVGTGLYYRALQVRMARYLQPEVERFLADEILQSPGPIRWREIVWLGHFPHPPFITLGKTAARADGASAGVMLRWVRSDLRTLSEVEFPEGPAEWRDRTRPQFEVWFSDPPGAGPQGRPTPADLVRQGWLRPSLGAEFMAHPTSSGTYTADVGGFGAEYHAGPYSPRIVFSGRYRPGAPI